MKQVRKQSSARVSSIAARLLKKLSAVSARDWWLIGGVSDNQRMHAADIRALCASLLSQDETRGQAKPKRRRGK